MTEFQDFVKNTVEPELFSKTLFQEWLRERLKFGVGYVGVHDSNLPTENYMKQVVDKFGGEINFGVITVDVYDVTVTKIVTLQKAEWLYNLEVALFEWYATKSVLGSEVLGLLDEIS